MSQPESLKKIALYIDQGIAIDIYSAQISFEIFKTIGQTSKSLNESGYGSLFGNLQAILAENIILSLTKVFEEPNKPKGKRKPFEIVSLPTTLNFLNEKSNSIPLKRRDRFIAKLKTIDARFNKINDAMSDTDVVTQAFAYYREALRSIEKSAAFKALKYRRNKTIGHREAIDISTGHNTTWIEVEKLIRFGQNFIDLIAEGYLDTVHSTQSGDYFQGEYFERPSAALERLFSNSNITFAHS